MKVSILIPFVLGVELLLVSCSTAAPSVPEPKEPPKKVIKAVPKKVEPKVEVKETKVEVDKRCDSVSRYGATVGKLRDSGTSRHTLGAISSSPVLTPFPEIQDDVFNNPDLDIPQLEKRYLELCTKHGYENLGKMLRQLEDARAKKL